MKKYMMWLLVGCIITFSATASAETVYLKSGEKVTGKIVAQSSKSVMIQATNGAYYSYPADEIKEIKKKEIAERELAPNVVENVGRQLNSESSYLLKSDAGVVKISLPNKWKKHKSPELPDSKLDSIGTFILGDNVKECTAFLFINGKKDQEFDGINTKESQIYILTQFIKSFEKGKAFGGSTFSSKYEEFFEVVCLVVDYVSQDGNYIKEVYCVKNGALYKIAFAARSKETCDKEWPVVKQSLKTMEIHSTGE